MTLAKSGHPGTGALRFSAKSGMLVFGSEVEGPAAVASCFSAAGPLKKSSAWARGSGIFELYEDFLNALKFGKAHIYVVARSGSAHANASMVWVKWGLIGVFVPCATLTTHQVDAILQIACELRHQQVSVIKWIAFVKWTSALSVTTSRDCEALIGARLKQILTSSVTQMILIVVPPKGFT